MLHEVLLALSGHPSPLFDKNGRHDSSGLHSLLSPSEAALLEGIGRLAEHHRQLRRHAKWIASKHRSTICRAVATCIQETYLARFQKKILAVESKILTNDPIIVGAYDIVPLASVAAEFDDWHRLMQWLYDITCLMQPDGSSDPDSGCTGAALINRLRLEANTGFPEIEETAIGLSTVAEIAWLRQLAPWIVHGKLPIHSTADFFVKLESTSDTEPSFSKDKDLLPCFVSPATASSIVFIGKSIRQVGISLPRGPNAGRGSIDQKLAAAHLEQLRSLPLPINQARLSRAVSAVRLLLSRNVLQHLLPMSDITCLLAGLRRYFLLGHGEFATVLIDEAERQINARQQSMSRLLQQDPVKALQGLSIKDPELYQTLASTWKILARDDERGSDEVLDFARKHTTLETPKTDDNRPTSADSVSSYSQAISLVDFGDLLFPTPTVLHLDVGTPLDLLVSTQDVRNYTKLHSYLLAIRRAQHKLANLWRRTSARRNDTGKRRTDSRASLKHDTRKIWATSSAALFLVSETAAYYEGDIVRESCDHFEQWVKHPTASEESELSMDSALSNKQTKVAQRDPETLAAAHRAFLAALTYALLLTDVQYTRELRSLLGNIDALIAFFNCFLDLQQKADFGVESSYTTEEQQKMTLELDRARKKVDSDLRSVVNRLRQLDRDRLGSQRYLYVPVQESCGFEPWKGGGVDRLLMKLEFGRMRDEEMGWDIV